LGHLFRWSTTFLYIQDEWVLFKDSNKHVVTVTTATWVPFMSHLLRIHINHAGKRRRKVMSAEKSDAGFQLFLRQPLKSTHKTNCNFIKYDQPVQQ
jgi:hypothetical protein